MSFNCFPVELHHQILCFMDPEDLLALRKTSKYFLALTHEPRLWTSVYYHIRQTHALGCSQSEFAALTPCQSERLLVRASKTQRVFQTFREHPQRHIFPSGQTRKLGPLAALSFLSERFLLSVDETTVVYVWDISNAGSAVDEEAPSFPRARLTLVGWKFLTYSMSNDHSTLYVVLSKGARAHIFSLVLPLTTSNAEEVFKFRDVAYLDTHFNNIDSIDPESCLVLLQLSNAIIEVVDWRTEARASVLVHQQGIEEHPNRNYVHALRICGPYILCFRRWSVDAYPIPAPFLDPARAREPPLPVLQHIMPGTAFIRKTSLSRVRHTRSPSGDVYTLYALAEDQRQGMHHYQVHVHTTPVPALSVRLLAFGAAEADRRVSAWDLGESGMRGAWVCTYMGEARYVAAFAASASVYPEPSLFSLLSLSFSDSLEGGTLEMPPEVVPRFEAEVVSTVASRYSDGELRFLCSMVMMTVVLF
ncbi:hypothetical protein OG21DRAFT_669641 [Imleria badia]|nr:hypothetical protein OG21DRAFT_669641 [Imleria badia]